MADEASQTTWVNESLSTLRGLINSGNRTNQYDVLFGNYYQLIDVDTDGVGQETHFGILHSDLSHKEAYPSLRQMISQF